MSRRLFFGLKPDQTVRNAIDSSYRSQSGFRGLPLHPDDLHMTLFFLGQVDGPLSCIREAASFVQGTPFSITLDHYEYWTRPRVLTMRPGTVPMELATLYQQLSDGLLDCGYSAEGRSYKPHITLARKAKELAETELPKPIEWQIDRFFLYVSTPVVAPPRYQVIAQWPLTTGS